MHIEHINYVASGKMKMYSFGYIFPSFRHFTLILILQYLLTLFCHGGVLSFKFDCLYTNCLN